MDDTFLDLPRNETDQFSSWCFPDDRKKNCSRIFTAREQLVPLKGCATINFKALSPLEFAGKRSLSFLKGTLRHIDISLLVRRQVW